MLRIATFNIENLDDPQPGAPHEPTFAARAAVLRPTLERLTADVLCLQEVHGQNQADGLRALATLERLLAETRYRDYEVRSTRTTSGKVFRHRNLVTLIRPGLTFGRVAQLQNDIAPAPQYRVVTSGDPEEPVKDIRWERPLLHTEVVWPSGARLHVLNVHFKSKRPTDIAEQKRDRFSWRSAAGWAEGFFLSSMKRVGAALEARMFLDRLFEAEPDARIVICGDFNADSDQVPVMALRGRVEDTANEELAGRVMIPCESSVPAPSRFSLYHHGRPQMLDHLLVSRAMIALYRGTEIHNETLPDESVAFAFDRIFPESDHAPVVATFDLDLASA